MQFYWVGRQHKMHRNAAYRILNVENLAFPGRTERLFAFFYKPDFSSLPCLLRNSTGGGSGSNRSSLDVINNSGGGSSSPSSPSSPLSLLSLRKGSSQEPVSMDEDIENTEQQQQRDERPGSGGASPSSSSSSSSSSPRTSISRYQLHPKHSPPVVHLSRKMSITACNGWEVYSTRDEYQRQGVLNSKNWRMTDMNSNYKYCPSYPSQLVVPASISDDELVEVFGFRSRGRIPVLCYLHSSNDTTLCRCSQPLAGIKQKRSRADENLFRAILAASPAPRSNKGMCIRVVWCV